MQGIRRGVTVPRAAGAMAATGLAVLAGRYARERAAADRDWAGRVEARLADLARWMPFRYCRSWSASRASGPAWG
jgi:hypothetical protein